LNHPWILNWDEAATAGPSRCGGKGWNLGRLHRYGFLVPAGGVLIADAYTHFLNTPAFAALRESLADVTATQASDPEVVRRLDALKAVIREQEIPSAVCDAVASFLAEHHLDGVPLAVRSSATAEDSALASFAGIHRSSLHCRGLEQVLHDIRDCYASLWTPAALAYRRRLHLTDEQVACAVAFCSMIAPQSPELYQVSGVAFSCDPRSGWRDRIILNAVPGLGDALVGGREQPEEIVVHLSRGHLRVTERRGRTEGVLSDAQALELARLAWRVHWALGDGQQPQDIEWTHDGRRFWLLQARPVTRLPPATVPALAGRPVCWSNANIKEVIPGVPTTLTWSILQPALWSILYAVQSAVGYRLPPGLEMVRRHAGRLYFDLSALQWIFYDSFGVHPTVTDHLLGGHQPRIDVPPRSPLRGRRGLGRLLANVRLSVVMLMAPGRLAEFTPRIQRLIRAAKALNWSQQTPAQLLEWLYRLGDRSLPVGLLAQLINASAGGWHTVLQTVLGWRIGERGPALTAALMAGSGQVTSAAHGYRLLDLADAARRDAAARDYLDRVPLDPLGWRALPANSPFRIALERFLADFGHRAVYEIEMSNPRWNEDPTYLLEQVRFLLANPPPRSPRDAARAMRAGAESELARRTVFLRPLVHWLANRTRRAAAAREAGKSIMVATWEPMRYAVLEVGRRLTAAGSLDRADDVFHLSYLDVESYLRGEWDGRGARRLVADRRAQHTAWLAETPPDVFFDNEDGIYPHKATDDKASILPAHASTWTGLALSAGRASGPARILRHPDEAPRLQAGDVLVAPSTDPGWTPLFLRASALVMEVGGYLSHGAIVAREYGIPAVSNLPGVLDAVRDGQRLIVDGDTGSVLRDGETS
jgi:pyruvate,water dikinase